MQARGPCAGAGLALSALAMPLTEQQLLERLASLGIAAVTHRHPPVATVEEAKARRGQLPGAHIKNLFLKDKRGTLWLIVAEEDQPVDLKALRRALGTAPLSFAGADLVYEVLGVAPGAVTPFAVVNDEAGRVTVVIDEALLAAPLINAHPLTNTATTALTPADLLRFLKACGHPPRILPLPAPGP